MENTKKMLRGIYNKAGKNISPLLLYVPETSSEITRIICFKKNADATYPFSSLLNGYVFMILYVPTSHEDCLSA
jgi:hypothetical protein